MWATPFVRSSRDGLRNECPVQADNDGRMAVAAARRVRRLFALGAPNFFFFFSLRYWSDVPVDPVELI